MTPIFCFIDDSSFEIQLFKEVYEKHHIGTTFVYGTTFEELHEHLQRNNLIPSLFILDLYGRTSTVQNTEIPRQPALNEKTRGIRTLNDVYSNLDAFRNDPDLQVNEYLKRLFSIISAWRTLFSDIASTLDQSPEYGICNLKYVREFYPDTAAVIYTRKGLFNDAIRLAELGCDGIFMKPPGQTDDEILAATNAQRDDLMSKWSNIVKKTIKSR